MNTGSRIRKLLKYSPLFVAVLALFSLISYMFRPFWFDESLTIGLVGALAGKGILAVYRAYDIPNNHIVFSVLLDWCLDIAGYLKTSHLYVYRIPSMIFGMASILLMMRGLSRRFGTLCAFFVMACFCVSPFFGVFATAVRGYMLGFLLVIFAFYAAKRWMWKFSFPALLLFMLISYLAVGVMPTNLAALAAVCMMFLPRLFNKTLSRAKEIWKLLLLSIIPPAALVAFYFPISEKFMSHMSLGEGWFSASNAVWNLYMAFVLVVLPLIPFSLYGFIRLWRKKPALRISIVTAMLIFLLPLPAFFIFNPPIFPRVFFPLFPIWLFWAAFGFSGYLRGSGKMEMKRAILPGVLVLIWMFLSMYHAPAISNFVFGDDSRRDDMYLPHYARIQEFAPDKTLRWLAEYAGENGDDFVAFVTFDADYPTINLYALHNHLLYDGKNIIFDHPIKGQIETLPKNKKIFIVCYDEQDLESYMKRFGLTDAVLRFDNHMQKIYEVR